MYIRRSHVHAEARNQDHIEARALTCFPTTEVYMISLGSPSHRVFGPLVFSPLCKLQWLFIGHADKNAPQRF